MSDRPSAQSKAGSTLLDEPSIDLPVAITRSLHDVAADEERGR
ncbi:MAG: hypothetical protein R2706_18305 [Acidimicrobiales bacterium]